MNRQLPSALDLTRPQFDGWACVWCSTPLRKGAVSAGRTEGRIGAHDLGVEVYACPACATAPQVPAMPRLEAGQSGSPNRGQDQPDLTITKE